MFYERRLRSAWQAEQNDKASYAVRTISQIDVKSVLDAFSRRMLYKMEATETNAEKTP